MKPTLQDHPGVQVGSWLKGRRQARGIIARVFARKIWLTPAKYAEVEAGVIRWLGRQQEQLVALLLELTKDEVEHFTKILTAARNCVLLTFADIFSKEDLKPLRLAHTEGRQITKDEEDRLLNIVFAPLA